MYTITPDDDTPWELLARCVVDEATPEQWEELRTWVSQRPERLRVLADITRCWNHSGTIPSTAPISDEDVESAWQRFRSLMQPG